MGGHGEQNRKPAINTPDGGIDGVQVSLGEVHLKDNPHFLGKGRIDFGAIVDALVDSGFTGWAQLETDSPTGDVAADMAVNLSYVRRLMRDDSKK